MWLYLLSVCVFFLPRVAVPGVPCEQLVSPTLPERETTACTVSFFVLALAPAFSYVTAAFGRACCVVISREITRSDFNYIT